jgi:GT2 family glycosyltransferase
MAYRRECALRIGGFASEFDGWRADTDFGFRMELEYGVDRCKYDPEMEVTHIGPLRTDVDRELEQKFRRRYPYRYFTVIYRPDVPFGKELGTVMAKLYCISPGTGEGILKFVKRYQSLLFNNVPNRA